MKRALAVSIIVLSVGACCGKQSTAPTHHPATAAYAKLTPEIRKLVLAVDDAIAESGCQDNGPKKQGYTMEPEPGSGGTWCGPRGALESMRWALLRTYGGCEACMERCPGCDLVCAGADLAEVLPLVDQKLALHTDVRKKLDAIWRLPRPFPAVPAGDRCARELGPGLQPGAACQVQDRRHANVGQQDLCAILAPCVPPDLSDVTASVPGICRALCDERTPDAPCPDGLRCHHWANGDRSFDVCVP